MNRPTKDEYFLKIAADVATRSTCLRRAVGCVLVNERGHILATGYNGVAAGQLHCNEAKTREAYYAHERVLSPGEIRKPQGLSCDDLPDLVISYPHACEGANSKSGTDLDKCQAIHAEANALLQCHDVHQIQTCYVTTAPCVGCTKLLLGTSCKRIVAQTAYASSGEQLWISARRGWAVWKQDSPGW